MSLGDLTATNLLVGLPSSLSTADAVRWACVLEATAPKVGNVHPGASFDDLRYIDFVHAAETTASVLCDPSLPIGTRIARAVDHSGRGVGNVNLGIVLLFAPMIGPADRGDLGPAAIEREIASWSAADAAQIYGVIASTAGGLGDSDRHDVRQSSMRSEPPPIVDAMTAAADRDRVALQYAGGFVDLFENIVPALRRHCINDPLGGIVRCQIELLAGSVDSLIVRKCGLPAAERIRNLAGQTDPNDPDSIAHLDLVLRRDGHRYNPGTTADLIAAGLFVLLMDRHGGPTPPG